MFVILGLLVLLVAVVLAVVGVLGSSGTAHPLTESFSVFGYHVTGSTGTFVPVRAQSVVAGLTTHGQAVTNRPGSTHQPRH